MYLKENMYARNVGLRRCFMFTEELMQVKSLQFFLRRISLQKVGAKLMIKS